MSQNLAEEPEDRTIADVFDRIRNGLSDETKKEIDDLTKTEWDFEFYTHLHHWYLILGFTLRWDDIYTVNFLCFTWQWSRNEFYAGELSSIFKKPAIWIWRNLSGGESAFYEGAGLQKYKAPIPPSDQDWNGWKFWLWNKAVEHLIYTRHVSHTPTLRVKF